MPTSELNDSKKLQLAPAHTLEDAVASQSFVACSPGNKNRTESGWQQLAICWKRKTDVSAQTGMGQI